MKYYSDVSPDSRSVWIEISHRAGNEKVTELECFIGSYLI